MPVAENSPSTMHRSPKRLRSPFLALLWREDVDVPPMTTGEKATKRDAAAFARDSASAPARAAASARDSASALA